MKNKNFFWGVIFILAAAFVLLSNLGYFEDIHITKIIIALLLVYIMLKDIPVREFFGVLLPLAVILIMYDEELHLTSVSPFPLLAAAVLGSIGLTFLFPKKPLFQPEEPVKPNDNASGERMNGSDVNCNVSFAGSTKYINTAAFKRAYLKCSFGSLKVYFDHTTIAGESAEIFVENSFGETVLFLPKDWNVNVSVTTSFGDIEEIHKLSLPADAVPKVTVRGNISFGDCKIYYI